ncbi:MAG: flagellar motor switch phosphatase FliY [Vampirovibrio sp.]|nr:flagellar motor switch phosphatase FliY [Vampirovibrio sp.]
MANEQLSQEELDKLIQEAAEGIESGDSAEAGAGGDSAGPLGKDEQETIQEMGNLSIGAAISSLSALLGREINAPTPTLTECDSLDSFEEPFAGSAKTSAFVQYTAGMPHLALIVLKNTDVKNITNLMLGDETPPDDSPLSEMQTGAISEALSQMMNASAGSMASIISGSVEAGMPEVAEYDADIVVQRLAAANEGGYVQLTYALDMGDAGTVELVQILSMQDAKQQVAVLLSANPENTQDNPDMAMANAAAAVNIDGDAAGGEQVQSNPVMVQPVQFSSLDDQPSLYGEQNKNLELVMDVTLNLSVELGRTEISIKEVLELTRGSVIELDRIAGEPVDLMANGKLIAKGEVVVIEDNFGLRITSIVSPAERLRGL